MPTQATRIIKNCKTGEETIETYEIPDPTPEEIAAAAAKAAADLQAGIVNKVQARLDSFALTRNYDSVNSISKYQNITDEEIASLPVGDQATVTRFRTECRYLALVTAQTWAKLYAVLEQVGTGNRVVASYEDIEGDLPILVWP